MLSSRLPPVPAVLRLVQTAVLGRWRATEEDLYREVARLAGAAPGREVLVSGCGTGAITEWLTLRTGASVTGVDPDSGSIASAESRSRALDPALPLHYAQSPLDDLPHETAVFDVAVGGPPLSVADDPARAVAELTRVTRPRGSIVLLQPTWIADLSAEARELIVERLGFRPHLLVEWRRMLRDAGVVDVQVQDWTGGGRPRGSALPSDVPQFNWRQKMQIIARAWRALGWHAARSAVARETRLLRELSRERTIGLQLITGVKLPQPAGSP